VNGDRLADVWQGISSAEFLGGQSPAAHPYSPTPIRLGGVDKFEPVSGGGDLDHAEEAFGELIASGCDGAVDFQATEEAFDVVALFVEGAVMFDLDPAV
jgi:hypothetical protein